MTPLVAIYLLWAVWFLTWLTASLWTSPALVERHYINLYGFGMAAQARAVTESFLLGRFTITIDYQGYQMQVQP